jgi:hypothetical protein
MNDEIHNYTVEKKSKAALFITGSDKKKLIKFGIAAAATVIGIGLTVGSLGLAAYDMAVFYGIATTVAAKIAAHKYAAVNENYHTVTKK